MSESIRVVCPNCLATYNLPPTAIGKSAACKQCNAKFTVKVAPRELPAAELPEPESPPAAVVVPLRFADEHPPKVTYLPAPVESARPRRERPRADEVEITQRQAGRFGNGFLTMFGCLSAVVVFGGLCVLFVCGGGLTLLGIGSAGARRAAEERLAREQQAEQLAATNPVAPHAPVPGKSQSDALVVPGKSGASPTQPSVLPAGTGDTFIDWEKPAVVDRVWVGITTAAPGRVELVSDFGRETRRTDADFFVVTLSVGNSSEDRKLNFSTWMGGDFSIVKDYATLKDEYGNIYKRMDFGFGKRPKGGAGKSESVYPKKYVGDVLAFELPVATAKFLTLTLPCKNFGSEGEVKFRIPTNTPRKSLAPTSTGPEKSDVKPSPVESTPEPAPTPTPKVKPKQPPAQPLELKATHTVTPKVVGTTTIPVPAGKVGKHVESYEAGAEAERAKLVKDGEVCLIAEPTPVAVESTRDGWCYCRPTEGAHKGKLLVLREAGVKPVK